jgi:hypothetical protein
MFIDFVTGSLRSILSEEAVVISQHAASRRRCERWLQNEVLKRLTRSLGFEIESEHAFPSGSRERCDLWCRESDRRESWVELKTCVTNYEQKYGPKSPRPITNQIADAIRDIERLAKLPLEAERHLLLLAYPMPANGIPPPQWSDHLGRLRNSGGKVTQVLMAPVCVTLRKASVIGYAIAP